MRWLIPLLFLGGCLTLPPTHSDIEQARRIGYEYARGFTDAPELERPDLKFTDDLAKMIDVPDGFTAYAVYVPTERTIYVSNDWQDDVWGTSVMVHEHIHFFQHFHAAARLYKGWCLRDIEREAFEGQKGYLEWETGRKIPDDWAAE